MYQFEIEKDYIFIDNKSKINAIYLSEYDDLDLNFLKNAFQIKCVNWYILKYNQLYKLGKEITISNYYKFSNDFLESLTTKNIVIVGHGFGGLLANYFNYLSNDRFIATLLVNPITSVGYINPYVSNIPSYKFNKKSTYLQLSKQYYYLTDMYGDFNDERFLKYFNNIQEYIPYFDTLRGLLSDYSNLKMVHNIEIRIPSNTYVILGNDNQIINPNLTYDWLRNNNPTIMIFNMTNASHYLYIDQPIIFNDLFKSVIDKAIKIKHEK